MKKCFNYKTCLQKIPNTIKIEGIKRNLSSRKYCLICNPFKEPRRYFKKMKKFKLDSLKPTDIAKAVQKSSSWSEVLCNLKLSNWRNVNYIKLKCNELQIDTTHVTGKRKRDKIDLGEIFKLGSFSHHIKKIALREGLLKNICSICGLEPFWNNAPLVLQLDHINGSKYDNRLENLRLVCPNCHTQTDTFCSKNFKREVLINNCLDCGAVILKTSKRCPRCAAISRKNSYLPKNGNYVKQTTGEQLPPLTEIKENIRKLGYVQTGSHYNVSDNTVRKWLRVYGIDPKTIKKEY